MRKKNKNKKAISKVSQRLLTASTRVGWGQVNEKIVFFLGRARKTRRKKKKGFGQAILADDLLALRRLLVLKDTADQVVKGAEEVVPFVIDAIIKPLRKFFICY